MIGLRRAVEADLPMLHQWDEQPHVKAASGNDALDDRDWLAEWFPPLRGWLEVLIAESDGRAIGVVQVIDPAEDETHYWGACEPNLLALDIWLGALEDTGKGYGTEIMRQVIGRCFANPAVEAILLDPLASNTRAHAFYERLGFCNMGPRRFGEDDCIVYRLDRANAKLRLA